ncbi:hypothetical protein QFZ20_001857 [Flavobacterium sp. W4I14]|nr:hypothetical protein [Flavobacterium sp. W4I14]
MVEVRIFLIHGSVDDTFWRFVIPNLIGNHAVLMNAVEEKKAYE